MQHQRHDGEGTRIENYTWPIKTYSAFARVVWGQFCVQKVSQRPTAITADDLIMGKGERLYSTFQ
ncbi:hypothetical protein D3C80_1349850 [compost metagenome]